MAKIPHSYKVPSNYDQVKKLRSNKSIAINKCCHVLDSTKLRDYQTIGTLNLAVMLRMILGDDPGLGKTLQVLVAYAIQKQSDPSARLLVVTTKSAMAQWGKEVKKFLTGISYHVLSNSYKSRTGSKKEIGSKARDLQYKELTDVDVLITGYYPVSEEYNRLVENRGANFTVVFDECQAFKNDDTKAFVGAEYIATAATRVYGLTATPIKNRLIEFYNIFKVIVPGLFPRITAFKDQFTVQEYKMVPQRGGRPRMVKQVVDYKNLPEFKNIIDPYFLKRLADDVAADLPSIVSRKIEVEMTAAQKKAYAEAIAGIIYEKKVRQRYFEIQEKYNATDKPDEKLSKDYALISDKYDEVLSGDFLSKNKAAALTYCQLVCNGPAWVGEEGPSAKEDAFEDLMEGELYGSKVIVFTRFKSGIERLQEILNKMDVKSVRVTGSENDKARETAMETFQDPESDIKVIFITQAGSAAINLQTSGILLFYDTPWSFGDLVQTIGRARRIGSLHKNVIVYHLVCANSIDGHVLDVLKVKKLLSDQVVGAQARGALEFDGEENIPEFKLDERGEVDLLFDEVFGRKS